MTTKLSVNLNKVALLRNQRDLTYPSVTGIAELVIAAGAHGITVHPRPDQRHIRPGDVRELGALIAERFADTIEFNIEGYPTDEFLALVADVKPTQVTLVPDAPDQRTSDHGWDVAANRSVLQPVIATLRNGGARVSLFLDPEPAAVEAVASVGADRIELYTEPYARAFTAGDFDAALERYATTAQAAVEAGLGINAGHDLTAENLPAFKARVPNLAEVSIGHAITADALTIGFAAAVQRYLDAVA
jgi:pyridoxine 5-phosphate synthase